MKLNAGGFEIWTGNVIYRIDAGAERGFTVFEAEVPGTGVRLAFDTRHAVDTGLTFLGKSDWTYLDAECQRLGEAGGLMVAEECLHFGGRGPARALRLKIENLLPHMEGTLVIDFSGVRNPSSSFLDELIGRLAARLGLADLTARIQVVNASPHTIADANRLIHERLGGGSRRP